MVEDAGAEGAEMAVEPGSTTQVEGEDGGAHEGAEQAAFQASWSQFAAKPTSFSPLAAAATDFQAPDFTNNFLKDALWSPDGLCILTSSDDNSVRLFEAPSWASDPAQLKSEWGQEHDCMRSVLQVKEGETIYDLAWYPGMNSSSPATCCFFSTSRDNPVHVWDAFTGADRGSYCAYTDAEELSASLFLPLTSHGPFNPLSSFHHVRAPCLLTCALTRLRCAQLRHTRWVLTRRRRSCTAATTTASASSMSNVQGPPPLSLSVKLEFPSLCAVWASLSVLAHARH
eukprot:3593419-Rhodomonas_salina.1